MIGDQLKLPTFPLVRTEDPDTSRETADVIKPKLGKIQVEVLAAFRDLGPMCAREAEQLFTQYGFSTVRKRISELARAGYLTRCGTDRSQRSPAAIYKATPFDAPPMDAE